MDYRDFINRDNIEILRGLAPTYTHTTYDIRYSVQYSTVQYSTINRRMEVLYGKLLILVRFVLLRLHTM